MTVLNSFVARGSFTITPDNDNDLPQKAFGVYCSGTAGTFHFIGDDGVEDTVNLTQFQTYSVVVVKVFEDSTATNLHGYRAY